MASTASHSPHSPMHPYPKRPRGILKNPSHTSPPVSPVSPDNRTLSSKELTIVNTQYNAGRRRSSSGAQLRRISSRTPSHHGDENPEEPSQRLKWDEANLYLTEQERTSTMKITEPKTPFAKSYDPLEDPSDDDEIMGEGLGESITGDNYFKTSSSDRRPGREGNIPNLDLGEPEEAVPPSELSPSKEGGDHRHVAVHVDDAGGAGNDDEMVGMSAEEREKHRRFEELRKKHYEMRNAVQLLGHPEVVEDDDDDDDNDTAEQPLVPPMPAIPANFRSTNGSS
ncbi:hypothetical protein jhhlp_008667 [Lomentospora prolificans]|uniref:Glc8 protein n=1 Tax=Lomentospora prolificans TaxID=41688 RepID=A0A2N3MYQ8_9PEZI|nr:hypothetical protein jhhlp_008667 [Lomentospora prolificans]